MFMTTSTELGPSFSDSNIAAALDHACMAEGVHELKEYKKTAIHAFFVTTFKGLFTI